MIRGDFISYPGRRVTMFTLHWQLRQQISRQKESTLSIRGLIRKQPMVNFTSDSKTTWQIDHWSYRRSTPRLLNRYFHCHRNTVLKPNSRLPPRSGISRAGQTVSRHQSAAIRIHFTYLKFIAMLRRHSGLEWQDQWYNRRIESSHCQFQCGNRHRFLDHNARIIKLAVVRINTEWNFAKADRHSIQLD